MVWKQPEFWLATKIPGWPWENQTIPLCSVCQLYDKNNAGLDLQGFITRDTTVIPTETSGGNMIDGSSFFFNVYLWCFGLRSKLALRKELVWSPKAATFPQWKCFEVFWFQLCGEERECDVPDGFKHIWGGGGGLCGTAADGPLSVINVQSNSRWQI